MNQPTGSVNQNGPSPSASSAIPASSSTGPAPMEHPAPPHPAFPLLQEQGERGDLIRQLHRLISDQFRHHCERGLPQWRRSRSTEWFEEGARLILNDLEISSAMSSNELREWINRIRNHPDELKEIYDYFKPKSK